MSGLWQTIGLFTTSCSSPHNLHRWSFRASFFAARKPRGLRALSRSGRPWPHSFESLRRVRRES